MRYLDLLADSVKRGFTDLDDITDLHSYNYVRKLQIAPRPTSFERTLTIRAIAIYLEVGYNEAKKRLNDFPHFRLGSDQRQVLYSREVLDYLFLKK